MRSTEWHETWDRTPAYESRCPWSAGSRQPGARARSDVDHRGRRSPHQARHSTCVFPATCTVKHRTPLTFSNALHMVVWCSGSMLVSINEVNLCHARLLLCWLTMSGFHFQYWKFISVCNQPPRSTQPGHPFVGRCNEYQTKGDDAWRLVSKGRYDSCVGGRWNCVLVTCWRYVNGLEMGHYKVLYKFTWFTLLLYNMSWDIQLPCNTTHVTWLGLTVSSHYPACWYNWYAHNQSNKSTALSLFWVSTNQWPENSQDI